jgi:hypothetical protein
VVPAVTSFSGGPGSTAPNTSTASRMVRPVSGTYTGTRSSGYSSGRRRGP